MATKKENEIAKPAAPAEPEMPAAPQLKMSTFVAPAAMLGLKYFDIDLTIYVQELRVAFGCVILLKFIVIGVVYMLSQNTKDDTKITVTEKGFDGVDKKKEQTVNEYDSAQVIKSAGAALFALCLTSGIHYKWGNPTPLLFQCLMGPMGLLEDPLVKIHVLGHKAEGDLQRPFKPPPSPFEGLMGAPAAAEEEPKPTKAIKRGKKDKKTD